MHEVTAEYLPKTLKSTPTCTSHNSAVLYKTYIVGFKRNLNVYRWIAYTRNSATLASIRELSSGVASPICGGGKVKTLAFSSWFFSSFSWFSSPFPQFLANFSLSGGTLPPPVGLSNFLHHCSCWPYAFTTAWPPWKVEPVTSLVLIWELFNWDQSVKNLLCNVTCLWQEVVCSNPHPAS